MRILDFADGFSSSTAPTIGWLPTSAFAQFASDAAFVTFKGSAAAAGDSYYNTTSGTVRYYTGSVWKDMADLSGVNGVSGTDIAPIVVDPAVGVVLGSGLFQTIFIKSNGGIVTVTANPQVAVPSSVGARLRLVGRSDTDAITLNDGNGLSLNGPRTLKADFVLDLFAKNATTWSEESYREN